jgi:hypothetical protein
MLYAEYRRQQRWAKVGIYVYLVVGFAAPCLALLIFTTLIVIDTIQNDAAALLALVSWWPIFVVLALIGISTSVLQILTFILNRSQAERLARVEQAVSALDRLRAEHPELANSNELNLTIKALRDEDAGQRNFWMNVFMSVFFLILGFLVSHILYALGWPH